MNHRNSSDLPAPCLVDSGIVVNKTDMLRLLRSLRRVRYIHRQDNEITNKGEGCVMEAFSDPNQATLVANRSLYLNVDSFDYLEMVTTDNDGESETNFVLVQDNRCLCLTPMNNTLDDRAARQLDAAALEAIVTEALSASWDASLDDERNLP
ncbi:MAG: hypothetical protein AAGC93_15415 [Cyanobacteria bacterium P01_F01_bin.53]